MSPWTVQQVLDAAPDASSVAAARKLAKAGPWSETGSTDDLLWGKCQGSGKTPYQVSIDLTRPAYRCSCPSRKFPCKHCLALMLLWAQGGGEIAAAAEAADFAAEWAAQASATKAAREAKADKPVDPEAQAKRLAARLATMDDGIEDFSRWVSDLVRSGLAQAKTQPLSWWETTAARLVDAQLPGLAVQVRSVSSVVNSSPDWAAELLEAAGEWWLTIKAWRQRTTLDDDTLADLRVAVGWSTPAEEARQRPAIVDRWQVVAVNRTEDGRLHEQRTWLVGEQTGQWVVMLDFSAGSAALPMSRAVGSSFRGGVHPYPGHSPQRVLLADELVPEADLNVLPPGGTLHDARAAFASQLTNNPWARQQPAVIEQLSFGFDAVVDGDGHAARLASDFVAWPVLALTGGHPVRCFGELEGDRFVPMTVELDGRLVVL